MSKSQSDPSGPTSTDWGLTGPKPPAGSQTRIALLLIVTLLGALSFFVYRKYSEHGAGAVQAADFSADPASGPALETPGPNDSDAPQLDREDDPADSSGEFPERFASGADPAPPADQSEPPVMDWFSQPARAQQEPEPETTRQPLSVAWPVSSQEEPPEAPSSDDERAFDLFAVQEEPSPPKTHESGDVPDDRAGSALPEPVDPFLMSPVAETSTAPVIEPARSDDTTSQDSRQPDNDGDPWSSAPALEPLQTTGQDAPDAWDEVPELIQVNSDDQLGNGTQQAAGFENPFFLDDEGPAAEPPPTTNPPAEPATFDFGTPAPAPPSNEPSPPVDWPAPAGGAGPSPGPSGSGTGSPTTTATAGNDPFATAVATTAPPAGFQDAVQVHTVRQGDSYWTIARRYYGAGRYFTALAAYNQSRIADPDDLQLGMKVLIPEAELLQQRYPALLGGGYVPGRAAALPGGFFMSRDGQPMYRVGRNDTLSSIAEAHLGRASRWRQIYGLNRDRLENADRLKLGLELRLPADASQAELVSRPAGVR